MTDDDDDSPYFRRLAEREANEVDYTGLSTAEVVDAGHGRAYLRLKTAGQPDQVIGAHDPRLIVVVEKWARTWNESVEAAWPFEWAYPTPSAPITAAAMIADAKGYGPTLEVMIRVGEKWRVYSPSKDKLLDELAKLAPDAVAEIPLEGGFRYQCFGSTLGTFGPAGDGLFQMVKSAEYASIVLYGETIDPA